MIDELGKYTTNDHLIHLLGDKLHSHSLDISCAETKPIWYNSKTKTPNWPTKYCLLSKDSNNYECKQWEMLERQERNYLLTSWDAKLFNLLDDQQVI